MERLDAQITFQNLCATLKLNFGPFSLSGEGKILGHCIVKLYFLSLIFMINLIINLMNEPYHKYKKSKYHLSSSKST